MRLLAIAILVMSSVTSRADIVVLGPATSARVSQAITDDVVAALKHAKLARSTAGIDRTCAADTTCLVTHAASAERVLSISVDVEGKTIAIELALVDVAARELIAKRMLSLRKLDQLAVLVTKFLDEAPVERAKELFAKGNQHYNLGELAEALVLYKRAYQITPLVEFLFNIAQCHRKLGQHREAITMYQSYLVAVPDAENRPLVEELIAESKAALETSERRETERVEQLRKAREAEALAAQERRKTEQVKSKRKVLPWFAIGIGAAALIGGAALYFTSETDDGTQPTYRDSRPAGIGVAIGGGVLAGTGLLWVARF
jgi:tetratricopeptide (TPR) repeat protein